METDKKTDMKTEKKADQPKAQKEPKIVKVDEMNIICKIPKAAASVTITAVIVDENDEPLKMMRRLSTEDIRIARQDFLDNVEDGDDYDGRFVITDEGMEYLKQLKQ